MTTTNNKIQNLVHDFQNNYQGRRPEIWIKGFKITTVERFHFLNRLKETSV